MKNELITIIVPMYNCEKYIKRCIDSIIMQTYYNYELILIDDGSTDETKTICNKYQNDRIKYYYKKNGGVSSARNLGLKYANGKYICFLDSDDWYERDFLKEMYQKIDSENADVCCCNGKFVYKDKSKKISNSFSKNHFIKNYFLDKIKSITCSFVIKKDIIYDNNIVFSEGINWGEDFEFFSRILINAKVITFTRKYLYNLNTIVTKNRLSFFDIKKIDDDNYIINRIVNYNLNDELRRCLINYRLPALIIYRLILAIKNNINENEIIRYYIKYKDIINNIKFCNGLRSIKLYFSNYKIDKYVLRNLRKKIAILTLCGNNNFGNKLQNYALIKKLKKMNYNAETIWVENAFIGTVMKQIARMIQHYIIDYVIKYKRNIFFVKFNKKLNISRKKIIFNNSIKKISKKYQTIIVGSDQVWNNNCSNNFNIYLLANSKLNKISYSASFGKKTIPVQYKENYRNALMDFKYISVREKNGKEIVEELTGRKDVEVLIDPTMLLSPKEWDEISNRPKQLDKIKKEKYILNYFLGNLSDSRKKEIEKIAKKYDCHIINILDKKDPFYTSGPSEFLYLEKHAFLICTDSFHSSVFAILYNRPFVIFDREQKEIENMNSRIDTLIDKFKLKNRRYNGKNITEDNLNHDYTEAYKILEKERKKSDEFLRKALDIKEGE